MSDALYDIAPSSMHEPANTTDAVPSPAAPSRTNDSDPAVSYVERRRKRLRAEAAVWMIRLDAGRAKEGDPALARWCARSPGHRDALAAARQSWERATPALQARTDAAMTAGSMAGVSPVDAGRLRSVPTSPTAARSGSKRGIRPSWTRIGGFGLAAALVGGIVVTKVALRADLENGAGAVTSYTLTDGSVIRLDAQSSLDIRYSATARHIVLRKGRAAFDVAHGDARPFVVDSGSASVTDIGTAFQVDRRDTPTKPLTVLVTQGAVRFANAGQSKTMHAGEIGQAMSDAAPSIRRVDGDSVNADTAWQRGRLQFDDRPLSEVVAALNRYFPGHHIFLGDAIAAQRVSGNFALNDPASALATLVEVLHLRQTTWAGRLIFLEAPSAV